MVYYLDDVSPASIQSGKDLENDFAFWMNNARPEFVDPVKASIKTVDEEALRTYARCCMDSECTTLYLIAAGTYNIVYFLGFSNGCEAIARVNREDKITNDQALLRDRVVSEASTLRYIKTHLSVPVPKVYYVNDNFPNPVGGRFIIEERILGRQVPLPKCTQLQLTAICTQLFRREAELISAQFTAIGSIFQDPENNTFYVGPMGPSVCRPLSHTVDRGPWTSTRDWLKAYIKSELSGILDDPEKYRQSRKRYGLDNGNPPFAYHVAWLETLLATMDKLEYLHSIPSAVERPVLFHEDLSGGNVLYSYPDPTVLAGIIDFEGACVVPLWSAMDEPTSFTDEGEENGSLLKLRLEILCEADPACAQAQSYRKPLCLLRWLVSMGLTTWCPTEKLCEKYRMMKEVWPVHEPAFTGLDELIALDPAGYCKGAELETA